jgi:zinc transporter ZupT
MARKLVCVLSLLAYASGEYGVEWAGTFPSSPELTWVASKVGKAYADETMNIALISVANTEDAFHSAEDTAQKLFAAGCGEAPVNTVLTPTSTGCYKLIFDQKDYESRWTMRFSNETDFFAVATEHDPHEFEAGSHYLRNPDGEDVEPILTNEAAAVMVPFEGAGYGIVFLGCLCVTLITVVGVTLLGFGVRTLDQFQGHLNGFAAGALLACAAYLMLIESAHMTSSGWSQSETESTWRWGTAFLGGLFLPIVFTAMAEVLGIDFVGKLRGEVDKSSARKLPACLLRCFRCPIDAENEVGKDGYDVAAARNAAKPEVQSTDVEEQAGKKEDSMDSHHSSSIALTTLVGLCVGDFFHNFVDGILIGAAFKLCNPSVAWALVAASAGHEVAQELGDFILYTSHPLSLPWHKAIIINFVVGLTCIAGGILMTGIDISQAALGLILAAGAGSYVYIGAAISLPAAIAGAYKAAGAENAALGHGAHGHTKGNLKAAKHLLLMLLSCILGATAIGLVLIKHEHCEAEGGGGGGGDGHGHRRRRF